MDYIDSLRDKADIYSGNPDYLPENISKPYAAYESACEELYSARQSGLICKEELEDLRNITIEAKRLYKAAMQKEYPEYFSEKINDAMAKKKTKNPDIQQYNAAKKKNPDALLLFRVGDFYETFKEDAQKVSETLGIKLTTDTKGAYKGIERAGFPHHRLDNYLPQLTGAGLRIAICEHPNDIDMLVANAVNKKGNEPEEAAKKKEGRAPQMVTVNGDKISHGHIFESSQTPGNWFFSARLNGEPMKIRHISPEEAEAFRNKAIGVAELMERYHPTKLMKRLSSEELATGRVLSDGRVVEKFNFYKETNPDSRDAGKYKMYAQVDGEKMSIPAPRTAINEYFDKVATPAQLVETHMGEKLHLASAYNKYTIPGGIEVDKVRLIKNPVGPWEIRARINGKETEAKTLSFDDGYSHFKAKTASETQLAAKYFHKEIASAANYIPSITVKDNDVSNNQTTSIKR